MQYGDQPDPSPCPGEVKVRVRAIALNRLDIYTRAGVRGTKLPDDRFPHILGGDSAGEVAELGEGISGPPVGTHVVVDPLMGPGDMLGTNRSGAYAEYVVVPAANVFPIPDSLGFEEAAALPTVYLPVWNIIIKHGKLQPNETALVLSAASGVGTAAIQVVKGVVGATCIATTGNAEKAKAALALGADHVIDYSKEDVAERLKEITGGRGVNLVVDSVGTQFFEAAYGSLARGGRYGVCGVTTGYKAELHLGQLFTKQIHLFGVFMGSLGDMQEVVDAAAKGLISSAIAERYPLEQAQQAHEAMEAADRFGKIVLTVA
ncbi:MAG: zinc-binding dehydrogenase [Chloroflexi bacterium]|nr:zinc-binding dehydrogenase [Chloroflexota bacterium]